MNVDIIKENRKAKDHKTKAAPKDIRPPTRGISIIKERTGEQMKPIPKNSIKKERSLLR